MNDLSSHGPRKKTMRSLFPRSVLVQTVNGRQYTLEFKEALGAASWSSSARVTGDGFVKSLTDPDTTRAQRFYRVRVD